MNVKEIITHYLLDRGYDGLCTDECGCGIDDLMPCDDSSKCVPAFRWTCGVCNKNDGCVCYDGESTHCWRPEKQK